MQYVRQATLTNVVPSRGPSAGGFLITLEGHAFSSTSVDVFFGSGDEAGKAAGRIKDPGRSVVLMPVLHVIDLFADG